MLRIGSIMSSLTAALAVSAGGRLLHTPSYVRMKVFAITGACAMVGVAIATALTSASYASPPSLGFEEALLTPFSYPAPTTPVSGGSLLDKEIAVLTDHGISPARAIQAVDVQSTVAQAPNLPSELGAAMGNTYAGVWFVPAAARFDIGVTSPASRRAAEEVVARAGLSADVTVMPVRSTIAQLLATQKQWDRKLAHLFALEEVATGLKPQRNAVSVTLSSSVPASERAVLKEDASASSVNVFVAVAGSPRLRVIPQANECNNFAAGSANCNPSITAGVAIQKPSATAGRGRGKSNKSTTLEGFEEKTLENVIPEEEVSGPGIPSETVVIEKPTTTSVLISEPATTGEETEFTFKTGAGCTAGPAAIPESNPAERVLLTAGHCIAAGGGARAKWLAFKRNATEKPWIGEAITYSNGGPLGTQAGDYGDIKIEPGGGWQTGNANNPVLAVTAEWGRTEETRYRVKEYREPKIGNMDCLEGSVSGEKCGEVTELNVTVSKGRNKIAEGLVEDTAKGADGDSGSPWLYVPSTDNPDHEALMEGTHVGRINNGTGNSVFEPLDRQVDFAAPGSLEALKLKLLTTANEAIRGFKVNGANIIAGEKVEAQTDSLSTVNQLESAVAGVGLHVTCEEALGSPGTENVLEEAGKVILKPEFKGCAVSDVSSKGVSEPLSVCKVKEGGFTVTSDGELTAAGILTLKPMGKEPFATITIEGNKESKCTVAGTFKIEGSQICTLPHYAVEAYAMVLACGPGGGKLTMGGEAARLYSTLGVTSAKGGKLSSN